MFSANYYRQSSFCRGEVGLHLILHLIPPSNKKTIIITYLNSKEKCSLCISNRKQTLKPKKEDPSMTKESGKLNQLSEYFMPGQLLLATVLHLQGFKMGSADSICICRTQ